MIVLMDIFIDTGIGHKVLRVPCWRQSLIASPQIVYSCKCRDCRCCLQTALVQVTPSRSMCLEDYSDLKALGRIALREGGRTVAVGLVMKVVEPESSTCS